ncbi:hypothetical protein, partial [Rhodoferax sp.]|uniref:hypothetical protein n=1 Tax=Rhodoferax sp. TaxID=50421 RepID=UPI002724C410
MFKDEFNLDSAVGRARVSCHGVHWQGATTQLAPASKEKQRRQGAPGRLNRVRSALTQRVNLIGAKKFNHFMILLRFQSGQLRNLGSNQC